jgi:hypothetical protein
VDSGEAHERVFYLMLAWIEHLRWSKNLQDLARWFGMKRGSKRGEYFRLPLNHWTFRGREITFRES